MVGNTIIRGAQEEDSKRIAKLIGQLGYPIEAEAIYRKIADLSRVKTEQILVAELKGKVVGVLSFHLIPLLHVPGNLGRITALVVDSRFRGRGIGKMLMEKAEDWAWINGCARIEVTSGDHRSQAHQFYQNNGYEVIERRFIKRKPA